MTEVTLQTEQFEKPDPVLTNKIVTQLKSQGIFDDFRKECMADVDTKPAYQNLRQRVEGSVAAFLKLNPWRPDINKNQLRENLRKHIQSGGFLDIGVNRIVDQVVNPKIYSVFLPKVEEVVQNCMTVVDGKPTFEPCPQVQMEPEPPKFQNKHNLAPRAALTGPRFSSIPTTDLHLVTPLEYGENNFSTVDVKSPTEEKSANQSFLDEEEVEIEEAEDDEESPPFEPHSQSDRLILGVRTDSDESNSDENQVVTTFVDDNLEERIDKNEDAKEGNEAIVNDEISIKKEEKEGNCETAVNNEIPMKEEYEEKEEDYETTVNDEIIIKENIEDEKEDDFETTVNNEISIKEDDEQEKDDYETTVNNEIAVKEEEREDGCISEDSVPKTPTINMEESDGTLIEFNSISEYKRYQSKFDEESLDNAEEEIISGNWTDYPVKECSGNEEDSIGVSKKRKMHNQNFNEKSNSSLDISSSCDEGKSNSFSSSTPKKMKLEDDSEMFDELMLNDDSITDKSVDTIEIKQKHSTSEHKEKLKGSSSSSREEKQHHHHSHKEHKESSCHHRSSKVKHSHREHRERMHSGSHSSRSKHDHYSKDENHDNTKYRTKEREKGGHPSSKHHSRDSKSKLDMGNENNIEPEKEKKHSRHEHRDSDYHEKEKKKQNKHDKHLAINKEHDSSNKHSSKTGSKSSKHSHSSTKHGHRSSSEKYRSNKDEKHVESTDRHKKSEKDSKQKKKQREHCKSSEKDFEGRRSSDRDSNGPSGKSYFSNSNMYKGSTNKNNVQTSIYTSEKTSSNSDDTVSDNVESLQLCSLQSDLTGEQGIASPDPEIAEEFNESDCDISTEKCDDEILEKDKQSLAVENLGNELSKSIDDSRDYNKNYNIKQESVLKDEAKQSESITCDQVVQSDENSLRKCDTFRNPKGYVCDEYKMDVQGIPIPAASLHDTSSEKENIDFAVNRKSSENMSTDENSTADDTVKKIKKPKIAANIFEVRKIMQERRHLKRMEKKRLKLLIKTTTEDSSSPNSLDSPETKNKEEDLFLGFDDAQTNKLEVYDCLINRLNNELSVMNNFEINLNLITSLIDINPDLDEYIETVLKGKVHRNVRVRLPPISEEFYTFDVEHNAYILIESAKELSDIKLGILDSNLENQDLSMNQDSFHETILDSNLENKDLSMNQDSCYETISDTLYQSTLSSRQDVSEEVGSRWRNSKLISGMFYESPSKSSCDVLKENTSPKNNSEIQNFILEINDSDDNKSSLSSMDDSASDQSEEELYDKKTVEGSNLITVDKIASTDIASNNLNIPKYQAPFSVTFNQTYDEILKEKVKNSENVSNKYNCESKGSTVIKITNNEIMKTVKFDILNKSQVPKITKSEPVLIGKSSQPTNQHKQIPRISCVKKSNNVVIAPSSTSGKTQNFASAESTHFETEVAIPDNISPKTINDMVGSYDNGCSRRKVAVITCLRQKNSNRDSKQNGLKQRYSSSDLYKPRPQLTSRRSRGQLLTPDTPVPAVITRKRTAATPEVVVISQKRRR